jgi:hypothetical protein
MRLRVSREKLKTWSERISAVLLALTAVASAWSVYQAARWNGQQARLFSASAAARTESVRASDLAAQEKALDIGLFVQDLTARSEGNTKLATFLEARFPSRLKVAYDAWLATKPFENPDAPSSPFSMKEYVVPEAVEAERLHRMAEARSAEAASANRASDHYVLATVLFALVLFLGGVGTKFESVSIQAALALLGALVFLGTLIFVLTLPVL